VHRVGATGFGRALVYRVLAWVARGLYGRCAAVISLGEVMTERLTEAGAARERVVEVHNWVPGEGPIRNYELGIRNCKEEGGVLIRNYELGIRNEESAAKSAKNTKVVAMYSGNLGLGHDLETFVCAAELLASMAGFKMVFVGGGKGRVPLERMVREKGLQNVHFEEPQPLEHLSESLAAGDIHLVSQKPGTQGLLVPSKIYGILAAGRPIVYVGPKDCEVGRIVQASQAGMVVAPGDVKGAAEAFSMLVGDLSLREGMGQRARAYYDAHFGRDRSVGKIVEVVERAGGIRNYELGIRN